MAVSAVVAVGALYAGQLVVLPDGSFVPRSFITHSVMLLASVGILWLVPRRRLSDCGFTRGTYRFRARILLWVLPTALLSLVSAFASGPSDTPAFLVGRSELQLVIFVWIYASVSEEVLTRGLLQTLISIGDAAKAGRTLFGIPVVVAVNRFTADTDAEIELVRKIAREAGAEDAVVSNVWAEGGKGGAELAEAVAAACEKPSEFKFLYPLDIPIK